MVYCGNTVFCEGQILTLSIVSKMMVAAPRPEANASRHGEACPKFMAAIRTPKNTCNEEVSIL